MGPSALCRALLYRGLPLPWRVALAGWACPLGARRWAPALIKDLARCDPAAYHRFLWTHHLTPALWFAARRALGSLAPSRRLLLADVARTLGPRRAFRSVLDVGCSAGYLLRAIELRTGAVEQLLGFDVDRVALRSGRHQLRRLGSRVRLIAGDLRCPPAPAAGRFDVVFCTGVLMYLPEAEARQVVARLLAQARQLLVLSGPAGCEGDNRTFAASLRRPDATFVHNFDAMVTAAGGKIVRRRWHGARRLGGQSIYFVLARGRRAGGPLPGLNPGDR